MHGHMKAGQKQWTTKGSQSSSSEGTSKYETGMDKSSFYQMDKMLKH